MIHHLVQMLATAVGHANVVAHITDPSARLAWVDAVAVAYRPLTGGENVGPDGYFMSWPPEIRQHAAAVHAAAKTVGAALRAPSDPLAMEDALAAVDAAQQSQRMP
jgi:hypothetical protein